MAFTIRIGNCLNPESMERDQHNNKLQKIAKDSARVKLQKMRTYDVKFTKH